MTWHILDVNSIWLKEFASALTRRVSVSAWSPDIRWLGHWERWERTSDCPDPALQIRSFPLQRGYSRFPLTAIAPFAPSLLRRLVQQDANPRNSVLVCTTPFYTPVAERWPGTVVYYQTDFTPAYVGMNPRHILELDRRMSRVATVVCPNSQRIADYLVNSAGCQPSKISIVPNATRSANILSELPHGPGPLPDEAADLPRPIAGVIGNLAANMDWVFLRDAIARTPGFSWLFVGPTNMPVYGADQNRARAELIARGGAVRFVGSRPYGQLQTYARAFDVAVLPYLRREPTFSGSSTRFYEHLAACRPMIATRGFAELLQKEPLLQLVDTGQEAAQALLQLERRNFRDGFERERWNASFRGVWGARADRMIESVSQAMASPSLAPLSAYSS